MIYFLFHIELEGKCGWIIGGDGGQRVCWPPSQIIGGGALALLPPLSSYAFETKFPDFVGVFLALKGSNCSEPGPEVIKLFSCSIQLSMNFFLLINVKMPIVGIVTFMSGKNSILSEPKKPNLLIYLYL